MPLSGSCYHKQLGWTSYRGCPPATIEVKHRPKFSGNTSSVVVEQGAVIRSCSQTHGSCLISTVLDKTTLVHMVRESMDWGVLHKLKSRGMAPDQIKLINCKELFFSQEWRLVSSLKLEYVASASLDSGTFHITKTFSVSAISWDHPFHRDGLALVTLFDLCKC